MKQIISFINCFDKHKILKFIVDCWAQGLTIEECERCLTIEKENFIITTELIEKVYDLLELEEYLFFEQEKNGDKND